MTYKDVVLADSPTGYWRLDEVDGAVAVDASGNGNHGTYVGAHQKGIASIVPLDQGGACVDLQGGYIEVPAFDLSNKSFTVELWVRVDSLSANRFLFANWNQDSTQRYIHCYIFTNGAIRFNFYSNDLASAAGIIAAGTVYHIAFVYDAALDLARIFVNGVERAMGNQGPMVAAATLCRFGANRQGGELFDGRMDECAVWVGTALSPQQIAAHYVAGAVEGLLNYRNEVAADAPTVWYPLAEAAGSTVVDESGNENHGSYAGSDYQLGQPSIVPNDKGTCAKFSNAAGGSYINVPNLNFQNKSFTVEGWFRWEGSALGLVALFNNYHSQTSLADLNCWQYNDGRVSLQYWGNDLYSPANTVRRDETYHYVARYDFGVDASSIWVNGVRVAQSNVGPMQQVATITRFLAHALGFGSLGSAPFQGRAQHLAIYLGTALPDARIQAHYFAGVRYWGDQPSDTPPDKPSITAIDEITGNAATLRGSPFNDEDGHAHAASQWQVDLLSGDFSSPVADSGEDPVNLTWYRVLGLEPMKEYKARVRYLDESGAWSEWSDPAVFMTATPPGWREFREDFKTGIEILSGVSIDRRPDAVSLDYLTAFAPGPVALGDSSQGLVARVWRVRADSSRVYYSRGAQSSWEKEKILFTYSGPPIVEIDAAFEQNGRFVVAAERHTGLNGAPEIWIYWFDPQLGGGQGDFVFQNFGAGRTPRVVLDNPLDSANSDVQVFYISDSDDAVVHRQQRDRYGNVILTPMTGVSNLFLEEVAFTKDKRVLVLVSRRNPTTGRYTLEKMYSKLPLQIQAGESMGLGASLVDAGLKEILKRHSASIEALGLGGSVPFVATESVAVLVGAETEEMGLGGFLASVGLAEVVVFPAAQPEALGLGGRAASAALAVAIIRQDTLEQLDIGASVVAASLTQ